MGYFSDIIKSTVSILQGMSATIKVYFSPPATIQYPFEPSKTQPTFRGVVVQLTDLATGKPKCTGCTLCAKACPPQAIYLETSRGEDKKIRVDRFAIDNGHCLVCNLCIEACNFNALYMAPKWDTLTEAREELIWEYDKLLEWGMPYSKAEEPRKPAATAAATKPAAPASPVAVPAVPAAPAAPAQGADTPAAPAPAAPAAPAVPGTTTVASAAPGDGANGGVAQ